MDETSGFILTRHITIFCVGAPFSLFFLPLPFLLDEMMESLSIYVCNALLRVEVSSHSIQLPFEYTLWFTFHFNINWICLFKSIISSSFDMELENDCHFVWHCEWFWYIYSSVAWSHGLCCATLGLKPVYRPHLYGLLLPFCCISLLFIILCFLIFVLIRWMVICDTILALVSQNISYYLSSFSVVINIFCILLSVFWNIRTIVWLHNFNFFYFN